jgi:hypothetical protein
MRATDCKDALTFSIPELDLKLLEAKKKHKETTKNGAQLQCAQVDKLDEARANHNHTSVAAERAQLKQTQGQREQGRALARLKNKTRQPVTMVTVTTNGFPKPRRTTKEDIEQACIAKNDSRFRQTKETPPCNRCCRVSLDSVRNSQPPRTSWPALLTTPMCSTLGCKK